MHVYVLATLDTKGSEAEFVCHRLNELGVATRLIDTSAEMPKTGDRGMAISQASAAVWDVVATAFQRGDVEGVLALGGSAGTTIGTTAMQALPIGVPKVMVSTLASGQTRPYVGDSDIVMVNSVVDLAGINRISRQILNAAAAAMAGMVKFRVAAGGHDKPLIAATMFGVTTPCVQHARQILEEAGYEVLVFHATGNGGQAMEALIRGGLIAGVLDITTTELVDELVGGTLSAGPTRLTAAAQCGVPQVVSVGALDMVNFGPMLTVPERFHQRKFHRHNDNVTLMRTTPAENAILGEEIARKLALATGPSTILLPQQGVSAIDRAGQPFEDSVARTALFDSIRRNLGGTTTCVQLDCHINDPAFAAQAARTLHEMLIPISTNASPPQPS